MKKIILVFSISLLLTACFKKENGPLHVKKTEQIFCGFDNTGSYLLFDSGKKDVVDALSQTSTGTAIFLREISGDSYSTKNSLQFYKIPEVTQSSFNPFSKKAKIMKKEADKNVDSIRQKLYEKCNSLSFKNYSRTDIDGFLLWVSEKMDTTNNNTIILVSDLDQNVDKYTHYLKANCLNRCKIIMASFQSNNPDIKLKWSEKFKTYGCSSVKFFEPGEKITL